MIKQNFSLLLLSVALFAGLISCTPPHETTLASHELKLVGGADTELADVFWRKRLQQIRRKTLPQMMAWADTVPVVDLRVAQQYAHVLVTAVNCCFFEPNEELHGRIERLTKRYVDQLATFEGVEFDSKLDQSMFVFTHKKMAEMLQRLDNLTWDACAFEESLARFATGAPEDALWSEQSLASLYPDTETLTVLYVATMDADTIRLKRLEEAWQQLTSTYLQPTGALVAEADSCHLMTTLRFAQWNQLLYLRTGHGQYMDMLERLLFNGLLVHYSVLGDEFCELAPLHRMWLPRREAWRADQPAMSELTSFLSGVMENFYAVLPGQIMVNLFTRSTTEFKQEKIDFLLTQRASYPWAGNAEFVLEMNEPQQFALHIRVPHWIQATHLSDVEKYPYTSGKSKIEVVVNEDRIPVVLNERGYMVIEREWHNDDFVGIRFTTKTRRVELSANQLGFQRGPVFYAVESLDTPCQREFTDHYFSSSSLTRTEFMNNFLDNVQTISGRMIHRKKGDELMFRAIPYYGLGTANSIGSVQLWIDQE